MKSFFIDKFEYNHFSNKKIIELIQNNPEVYSEKAKTLIAHTLNAQNIWDNRVMGLKPVQGVWDVFEISMLQKLNTVNHEESIQIISEFDLKSEINYKNFSGDSFSNSLENILFHIINHGTYHRGQLISELKLNGATPIATDFIFYKP